MRQISIDSYVIGRDNQNNETERYLLDDNLSGTFFTNNIRSQFSDDLNDNVGEIVALIHRQRDMPTTSNIFLIDEQVYNVDRIDRLMMDDHWRYSLSLSAIPRKMLNG